MDSCYSDMHTLDDDVHHFQDDLNANPAPPCLQDTDTNLRAALKLLDKAAQSVMTGISQDDPTQVDTGTSYMTQATRYINNATSSIQAAQC